MQKEKRFFASANTEKGFVSYFGEIFSVLDRVFILKGGPGTGKSHFIRGVADRAEKEGCDVEYFYCSSDPLSLDGIIIKDLRAAVIDGTAPHTYDPVYPGIRDTIINLGDNWSREILLENKKNITDIINKKEQIYGNIYNYLSAAGRIESEMSLCNKRAVKYDKLISAVARIGKGWKEGKGFVKERRLIEGMTQTGHIVYDTFHCMAENRYEIRDRYGVGTVFIEEIMKIAEQKKLKCVYSSGVVDLNSFRGIYLPEVSCSFVIGDNVVSDKKQINMERFVDLDYIKQNKQKNRFAKRCLSSLYEGVQKGFDEIYELHSRLEGCYIQAMDFSKNAELAEGVNAELFG